MSTYVNLRFVNESTSLVNAIAETRRESSIVKHPEAYVCSIDRFALDHCYLPVFHYEHSFKIKIIKTSDASETIASVDLDGVTDSDGFGYSLDDLVTQINNAVQVAAAGITAIDRPVLTLNDDNTCSLATTNTFRTAYEFNVSQQLFAGMSFRHYAPAFNDTWQYVRLRLSDDVTTTLSAVRFSCVSRIILITESIPVVPELTGSGSSLTNETKSIITDFNVTSDLYHPVNDLYFTSRTPKYHRMRRSRFQEANIAFYFAVHGRSGFYRVKLLESGACSCKIMFDAAE